MPDRYGASESEEAWTSATLDDAPARPQPQAALARIQQAATDQQQPKLQFMNVQFPEGWDLLSGENNRFHRDGYAVPGDSGSPQDVKPAWFDQQLFLEGQAATQKYLAGMAQADLLALLFLLGFPSGLDPLVATAKSDTVETAGRRYLSTNLRLLSWYTSDPFDPGSECYRNLVAVRRLHAAIRKTCTESPEEELRVKFQIGKDKPRALICPTGSLMKDTLSSIPSGAYLGPCPVLSTLGPDYPKGDISVTPDRYRRPFLSQTEMAITQWGFFGLFICKPEVFGAPNVTRQELESILHMWAVIGYCLGIEDHHNWALGGLDVVLKRSEEFLRYVGVPNLRKLTESGLDRWEHMSRCVMQGMKIYMPLASFETNVAYLTEDVLGLGTCLPKALSWRQTLQLWELRVVLQFIPRWISSWTSWLSVIFRWRLRRKGLEAGVRPGQEAVKEEAQDGARPPRVGGTAVSKSKAL